MLPKINQTIYIQTGEGADGAEPQSLRSRLADLDDDALYMEVPLDEKQGRYYRAQVGEPFQLSYFTPDGVKYTFRTTVSGLRKEEPTMLVAVRKPALEEIEREQRRSYLRVETQLELAVRIGDKLRFVALTDDVGGGGLSFRCDQKWPITQGLKMSCWLLLQYRSGNIAHAQFEGEVVRVVSVPPERYLVMIRFTDIQDSDQQKIIRYCFERQLEFRKD